MNSAAMFNATKVCEMAEWRLYITLVESEMIIADNYARDNIVSIVGMTPVSIRSLPVSGTVGKLKI